MKARHGICWRCRAAVLMITDSKGKALPYDPRMVTAAPELYAAARFISPDGDTFRGVLVDDADPDAHKCYVCHYDTCKGMEDGTCNR